jgi:hypothetical protein
MIGIGLKKMWLYLYKTLIALFRRTF